MPAPKLVIVSCADSPTVICAGSIVALTRGAAAKAGAVARYAMIVAVSPSRRFRFLLISPVLVRLFRRLVIVAAGKRYSERTPFVSLRRIEEFARFLAAHLPGLTLAIRSPRIVVSARLRIGARLPVARRLAGRGSGWRLAAVVARLIVI
jgi:hypothetical protein